MSSSLSTRSEIRNDAIRDSDITDSHNPTSQVTQSASRNNKEEDDRIALKKIPEVQITWQIFEKDSSQVY